MASIINWSIYAQPHGTHVTCQRPIVISTKVTLGQPAHFRGILHINSPHGSSTWVNTGVEFNAYSDSGNQIYECNVAEYCRQYFLDKREWFSQSWCGGHEEMFERRFKVELCPVLLTTAGTITVDYDDGKFTNIFNVHPINTQVWENNSMDSGKADYVRIDSYVQYKGNASGVGTAPGSMAVPLTNMAQRNAVNFDIGAGWYYYQGIVGLTSNRKLRITLTNEDNGNSYQIHTIAGGVDGTYGFPIHPVLAEFMIMLYAGTAQYILIDAAGNLLCNEYSIKFDYTNTSNSAVKNGPPKQVYTVKRDEQCGGKNVTTFVFRNMRGGIDWFLATGKEEKSVNVSGTTFNRHTNFSRTARPQFGIMTGQHSTTNLWNDREDSFSVFSQPLTDDVAIWLEELIVSPEAWIVRRVDNSAENAGLTNGSVLVAIIIDKGSYQIYNTENNVNYIEFKYKLSEHTLTQKN
tara:strand:+ start:5368 stop:6753 length:1386 start_codon:yes stop_codon:yes gene_type:complete